MTLYANMALELDTIPQKVNIWTGEGDIDILGVHYRSGRGIISFGNLEQAKDVDKRTTISFPVVDSAARLAILEGVPPVEARVYFILSTDYRTFTKRLRIKGKVSNVRIDNLVCSFEIETRKGDIDRTKPIRWSNEDQQNRISNVPIINAWEEYSIPDWATGRSYGEGSVITFGGNFFEANTQHISSDANDPSMPDVLSVPEVVGFTNPWTLIPSPIWITNRDYSVRDTVEIIAHLIAPDVPPHAEELIRASNVLTTSYDPLVDYPLFAHVNAAIEGDRHIEGSDEPLLLVYQTDGRLNLYLFDEPLSVEAEFGTGGIYENYTWTLVLDGIIVSFPALSNDPDNNQAHVFYSNPDVTNLVVTHGSIFNTFEMVLHIGAELAVLPENILFYHANAPHHSTIINGPGSPLITPVPEIPAYTTPWDIQNDPWSINRDYSVGNIRVYAAIAYRSNVVHTSILDNRPDMPSTPAVPEIPGYDSPWRLGVLGTDYTVFNILVNYGSSRVVLYNGVYYTTGNIRIQGIIPSAPDVPNTWTSSRPTPNWIINRDYSIDDLVAYEDVPTVAPNIPVYTDEAIRVGDTIAQANVINPSTALLTTFLYDNTSDNAVGDGHLIEYFGGNLVLTQVYYEIDGEILQFRFSTPFNFTTSLAAYNSIEDYTWTLVINGVTYFPGAYQGARGGSRRITVRYSLTSVPILAVGQTFEMVFHSGAQLSVAPTAYYYALVAHTSTEANKPSVGTEWSLVTEWELAQVIAEDDYRLYLDEVYQALIAHTATVVNRPDMNTSFTNPWNLVRDWRLGRIYQQNHDVVYNNILYVSLVAHTSSITNRPDIPSTPFVPAVPAFDSPWDVASDVVLAWAVGQDIIVGDQRLYAGSVYQADTAHTSTVTNRPDQPNTEATPEVVGNPGYWSVVEAPLWTPGTEYFNRDYSKYQNRLYKTDRNVLAVTGEEPDVPDIAHVPAMPAFENPWDLYLLAMWLANTIYEQGNLVEDGLTYRALRQNINIQPSTESTTPRTTPDSGLSKMAELERGIPSRWPA